MTPDALKDLRRSLEFLALDVESIERKAWTIKTQLSDLMYKLGEEKEDDI